jgi:hypothetical protein
VLATGKASYGRYVNHYLQTRRKREIGMDTTRNEMCRVNEKGDL